MFVMVWYRCSKCGREVEMPEGNYVCKLCLTPLEVKAANNPASLYPTLPPQPSFAIPPTYRTHKQRFEFLSIDHILKAVTSSRQAIARLEILRERAEGGEVEKINNIISNIKEIDKDLIEMKTSIERRGEQPTFEPMRFKDTADLDRRTKTESLITFAWVPLRNSCMFLVRGRGNLRNLHARLLEMGQTEEAKNVEREVEKLTEKGKELYEKQRQIRELKVGEP